ncbi:uncharacterized protein PHALS_12447 [Plasmopara halstedii]|uniref:Uncharacterized protein n=1 Tax=Plasmopara halstedii TaxID=4781 RepID=A0A0P1ALG1_PLAHL|nr:uncharacterized protein PHALS_12447 [Plasmopara halstedii]CEG42148.1 hypothetical protein PHALS_12447 [Plasmopara halstedii]|eukprot:XP_024578517.1 hypothetical protein PHALS_12447 [Plasmopara halstedii]
MGCLSQDYLGDHVEPGKLVEPFDLVHEWELPVQGWSEHRERFSALSEFSRVFLMKQSFLCSL